MKKMVPINKTAMVQLNARKKFLLFKNRRMATPHPAQTDAETALAKEQTVKITIPANHGLTPEGKNKVAVVVAFTQALGFTN